MATAQSQISAAEPVATTLGLHLMENPPRRRIWRIRDHYGQRPAGRINNNPKPCHRRCPRVNKQEDPPSYSFIAAWPSTHTGGAGRRRALLCKRAESALTVAVQETQSTGDDAWVGGFPTIDRLSGTAWPHGRQSIAVSLHQHRGERL